MHKLLVTSLLFFIYNTVSGLTMPEEFDHYTTCNGKTMEIPSDWITKAMNSAMECRGYEDEDCFRLCVLHKYDKMVVDDKPNMEFIRSHADTVKGLMKPEDEKEKQALESMVKEMEACSDKKTYPFPKEDAKCESFTEFKKCADKKFDEVCKK